jgi:hypothetical protein
MTVEKLKSVLTDQVYLNALINNSPLNDRQRTWVDSISVFYDHFFADADFRSELLDMYESNAKLLTHTPVIVALFPAGQLCRDYYDPTERRIAGWINTLSREHVSQSDIVNEAYHDIPDLDYLVVVRTTDSQAIRFLHSPLSEQYNMAREIIWNAPGWTETVAEIQARFTGPYKPGEPKPLLPGTSEASVERFVAEGKIDYSLANIIPIQIYDNLPYLIERDDFQYLNCLRDFIIGIGDPISENPNVIDNTKQQEFRVNLLLRLLSDKSYAFDQLIDRLFVEIGQTLPDRPSHQKAKYLVDIVRKHWIQVIQFSLKKNLVRYTDGQQITLTAHGYDQLDDVRQKRQLFLEKYTP